MVRRLITQLIANVDLPQCVGARQFLTLAAERDKVHGPPPIRAVLPEANAQADGARSAICLCSDNVDLPMGNLWRALGRQLKRICITLNREC